MKKWIAMSGLGEFLRARALYAVVPLAVPLVLATSQVSETPRSSAAAVVAPDRLPIRYSLLEVPAQPLPAHSMYIPIERGDTIETVLMDGGLTRSEAIQAGMALAEHVDPRRLRLGDLVKFECDETKTVQAVSLRVSGWGTVTARRSGDKFEVETTKAVLRNETITVSSEIDSSLYEAIRKTGESPQLAQDLVDVFQWDIDFFRLKDGDSFSLVVEKKFADEEHVGYGPILAARFHQAGQTYEAFRFEGSDRAGYYSRTGTPLRKQFLKAPLKFTRITSGFTHRRFHPILQRFRAHPGIDYGAPAGTPVMSTADGVVTFAGWGGGEGNVIRIRHNARMVTNYLHLSRFAKGIRPGTKISQGDVIGYVGATGLATGPHLDYRVSDGGKWLNPLQLKSITPDPLGGAALARFRANVGSLLARLEAADKQPVAIASRHLFGRQ